MGLANWFPASMTWHLGCGIRESPTRKLGQAHWSASLQPGGAIWVSPGRKA